MSAATKIRFIYDRTTFAVKRAIVPEGDDDELELHQPNAGEGYVDGQHPGFLYDLNDTNGPRSVPSPQRLQMMMLSALAEALA